MGRVNDTIGTVNTTLRTMLMVVLVGVAGIGGYKAYELYNEPLKELADKQAELDTTIGKLDTANKDLEARKKEIDELGTQLAERTAQVEKLEVSMRLLKVQKRLARLTVLDQQQAGNAQATDTTQAASDGNSPRDLLTRLEFVEVNEQGDPISEPKQFEIAGDMVYIDYLRVSFDDKYIEESDLDRSTAIALFQRIFGEHQEPVEGVVLDTVGTRPTAYGRGTEMSEFERKIWDDFWLIANDKNKAEQLGINAIHSTAVGQRVRPGMTYEITLRTTGDMTIRPIDVQRAAVNENPIPAQPPN
jgi:hypothetical protein